MPRLLCAMAWAGTGGAFDIGAEGFRTGGLGRGPFEGEYVGVANGEGE